MGSVGAVGAAPVLSRDVVVAAVRDLAYVLSCCSDVSAALAGPFPLGTETWPLAGERVWRRVASIGEWDRRMIYRRKAVGCAKTN